MLTELMECSTPSEARVLTASTRADVELLFKVTSTELFTTAYTTTTTTGGERCALRDEQHTDISYLYILYIIYIIYIYVEG